VGSDYNVRLFEKNGPQSFSSRVVYRGNTAFQAIEFSPDEERLAFGSSDGLIRLVTLSAADSVGLSSGVSTLTGEARILQVHFLGNRRLASLSEDGLIDIWEAPSQKALTGHKDMVYDVAVSPDGAWFASSGYDGDVRLWNAKTEESKIVLTHSGWVPAIEFSADGSMLASTGEDKLIKIYFLKTGETIELSDLEEMACGIAFSPDSKLLAAASNDNSIRLWDLTKKTSQVLYRHDHGANDVTFSKDGRLLASVGSDLKVRLWDISQNKSMGVLPTGMEGYRLWFFPGDSRLAVVGQTASIEVLDLNGKSERWAGHSRGVSDIDFSADGTEMVSSSFDGTLRFWDLATQTSRPLKMQNAKVAGVAFFPDGKKVVAGGSNNTLEFGEDSLTKDPGELRALLNQLDLPGP
jgi:WD40 repeat protein